MNILISSCVHWWNAEAAYAAALAEVLLEAGHQVTVLTRPGTTNWRHLDKRGLPLCTDIPLWSGNPIELWQAIGRLKSLQSRQNIQVVDVFHARELPWHRLAAVGSNGVKVVRTRGNARPARGHWLNRKLHRDWCDGLVASAEVVRQQMLTGLRLAPESVRTIYYPADSDNPPTTEQRESARAQLLAQFDLPPGTWLLGIVGRIAPEKGQRELVQAMASLVKRLPQVALFILDKGYEDEAPRRARLIEQITALGLTRKVHLLGFREDVRSLMSAMTLGVIPSLASEVNCRVAVEFFSVGRPVVAFPTGALPEVVRDGATGRVTRNYDPEALAEGLANLLEQPELCEAMGQAAQREAATRFSRARFLEASLAVFEGVIQ